MKILNMKILNFLNKNYYLNLVIFACLLIIMAFLATNEVIPYFLKLVSFLALTFISIYFLPVTLILDVPKSKNIAIEVISKFVFGISTALMALASFISIKSIMPILQVMVVVGSLFSMYLLFKNDSNTKGKFLPHFLLNFFLLGVLKMF